VGRLEGSQRFRGGGEDPFLGRRNRKKAQNRQDYEDSGKARPIPFILLFGKWTCGPHGNRIPFFF
jgi:hypothetical protein